MSMTPDGPHPDPAVVQPVPAPQEPSPAEVLRKRVYIGFAAIVAVGLAVAGLYIGGRLFARPKPQHEPLAVTTVAHHTSQQASQPAASKPSPTKAAAPVPAEVTATPTPAPAPPPNATAPGVPTLITPKTGEKYLQLAALPPEYTNRFVKTLEAKGIHASVAPGPSDNVYRVVIGPFADRSELQRQRDALDAAGIQWMPRVY